MSKEGQDLLLGFRIQLKECREMRGLTQADLGTRVGMQKAQIAHLESGERNPSVATLVKLAKALDVEPAYLFSCRSPAESKGTHVDLLLREVSRLEPADVLLMTEIARLLANRGK